MYLDAGNHCLEGLAGHLEHQQRLRVRLGGGEPQAKGSVTPLTGRLGAALRRRRPCGRAEPAVGWPIPGEGLGGPAEDGAVKRREPLQIPGRNLHVTRRDHPRTLRDAPDAIAPAAAPLATPTEIAHLTAALGLPSTRSGSPAAGLAALDDDVILAAWEATVTAFLDPASTERQALDPRLLAATGLSPEGLSASLRALLSGFRGAPLGVLAARARALATIEPAPRADGPLVVILAAEPVGLAVQTLLPALLRRRTVLYKTSTHERWFTPAFVASLASRLPAIGEAVVVTCWSGGDEGSERRALGDADQVIAYGGAAAVRSLAKRVPVDRLTVFGPRLSLGVLGADADLTAAARGFARDITGFDQRGCLALQAIFVAGAGGENATGASRRADELARHLATALADQPPPGTPTLAGLAGQRQVETDAALRGLPLYRVDPTEPAWGLVVVDPEPRLRPSPGLRTVRLLPIAAAAAIPAALASWRGQLQGVALAGADALALSCELTALGASWLAPPGELQCPDATWNNGDVDLLRRL